MSLFYSNPRGGRASGIFMILCESVDVVTHWVGGQAGIFYIFMILCESVDTMTQLNCLDFGRFCRQLLAHFLLPTLAHFLDVVLFFNMI